MRKYKIQHILILALFFGLQACGGAKKMVQKADTHYAKGEYAFAGEIYRKAYSKISFKDKDLRSVAAFKQGECYRQTNLPRAEQAYQNAVRNKYADSIVFFRLAQAEHKNGKFNAAIQNYNTYLNASPDDALAISCLQGARLADSLIANPSRYIIRRERDLNVGRSSSFSPSFAGIDGDLLIFTSNRKVSSKEKAQKNNKVSGQPNNSLFQIKRNSQKKWDKPEIVEGDINTKNDEGIASFTQNGQNIYFTRSITEDAKGDGTQILTAARSGGSWGAPSPITLYSDSTISVAHPTITPDGSTLYFVSDAPGGFGGKDIWRTKLEGGKPTFIENLGDQINTTGDEMFPTFKPDGTLYFSSNGHAGMGGLDIFEATEVTKEDSTKNWHVVNMGTPVNSSYDDFGMTFEGTTNTGYFASNRGETRGYDAIWHFELPELEYFLDGKILTRNGEVIPEARINVVSDDGETARINTKGDGSFRYKLKPNINYLLQASGNGYLNKSDTLSTFLVSRRKSETLTRNFKLMPSFESTRIDNIYYDFDKATLRPESKEGLNELIGMMNENPNITIELSSHTDYIGNNTYNRDLSARRAQSVVDYLIAAGIDGNRLKAIGYGEEKPIITDKHVVQQYPFLNEGVELNEQFILTLPATEQEKTNQINRRTEFIVTSTNFGLY